MDKVKVGIIGCGNISGNYLLNARKFPILDVVACADIDLARAQARAKEHNVPKACGVDDLLKDESIEIVINLTIPAVHAAVALQCIEAGKHVLNEKPLAVNRVEGKQIIDAAKKKKVRVGCGPDTFFGAAHQTARKLIDEGAIGRPVAATGYMMCRGHEGWHPDPGFFYKPGAGPMFDMGPYYVTDLMQLLGPVRSVTGTANVVIPERTITSQPKHGQKIKVETPDHITGTIAFESGCLVTLIMSFGVYHPYDPLPITIYGTEGTLRVPDPNGFDGAVQIWRAAAGAKGFEEAPQTHRTGYGRSVGTADMAYAIRSGRKHRASGQQGYAVLDVMESFLDAGRTGKTVKVKAKYERPAALPSGLPEGELDK